MSLYLPCSLFYSSIYTHLDLVLEVVKKHGVAIKYSHLASTSLHLHGEYSNCLSNLGQ
ncbi:hypothetical protein Aazo_0456 ['Nostoc azollae' 0708]|uniref:Uncharacterized protein n=1 Tax=Nostoc azollae (strain 0708) TaxID=551115 RepID=D7E083_NOSA0|nr:hypothetical protein Aazo_0456 ['Nostoc azollae' 0708]